MQVIPTIQNKQNVYELAPESINLVHFNKGRFILPKMVNLAQLRIVFTEPGTFYIDGGDYPICLGEVQEKLCMVEAGVPGYDTQPCFLFTPEKNKWFIISQGNFIFYTDEQAQQIEFDEPFRKECKYNTGGILACDRFNPLR